MKPTKRQIQIVEHFVKKTTKKVMNEGSVNAYPQEVISSIISKLTDLYKSVVDSDKSSSGLFTEFNAIKTSLKKLGAKLPKEEIWVRD